MFDTCFPIRANDMKLRIILQRLSGPKSQMGLLDDPRLRAQDDDGTDVRYLLDETDLSAMRAKRAYAALQHNLLGQAGLRDDQLAEATTGLSKQEGECLNALTKLAAMDPNLTMTEDAALEVLIHTEGARPAIPLASNKIDPAHPNLKLWQASIHQHHGKIETAARMVCQITLDGMSLGAGVVIARGLIATCTTVAQAIGQDAAKLCFQPDVQPSEQSSEQSLGRVIFQSETLADQGGFAILEYSAQDACTSLPLIKDAGHSAFGEKLFTIGFAVDTLASQAMGLLPSAKHVAPGVVVKDQSGRNTALSHDASTHCTPPGTPIFGLGNATNTIPTLLGLTTQGGACISSAEIADALLSLTRPDRAVPLGQNSPLSSIPEKDLSHALSL